MLAHQETYQKQDISKFKLKFRNNIGKWISCYNDKKKNTPAPQCLQDQIKYPLAAHFSLISIINISVHQFNWTTFISLIHYPMLVSATSSIGKILHHEQYECNKFLHNFCRNYHTSLVLIQKGLLNFCKFTK